MRKAIKEFQPDIIHFHWANPFPAAVLLTMIPRSVKLVIHWHMDIIKQSNLYPFIKPFERSLLKRANLIVVTSPQYRDGSLPLQPYRNKVKVLPSAMDEIKFILRPNDEKEIANLKARYGNKKIVFL